MGVRLYVVCLLVDAAIYLFIYFKIHLACINYAMQWSFVRTVSGWLVGSRSDRSMAGGWIHSKPVGWLVCLLIGQLEVWMVSGWLAD